MAKSSKKKKSIALRIFNILFIVAAVIAVAVAIMMFTPIASSLKGALNGAGPLAADIAAKLNAWVKFHICDNFGFGTTFRGHGVTFTSCMYIYIMCLGALLGFFLMYVPFLFRHRNKVDGKKDIWRKVLQWVAFAWVTIMFAGIFSLFFTQRLTRDLGAAWTWVRVFFDKVSGTFIAGHRLGALNLKFITSNPAVNGLIYGILVVILVEMILCIISIVGKKAKEAVAEGENEPEEQKAAAVGEVKETQLVPTGRELAVLNSLEAIKDTSVDELPEEGNVAAEDAVADLDNKDEQAVEAKAQEEAEEIAKELEPHKNAVKVLPGIDEFDAQPWDEVEEEAEEELTEEAAPEDETVAVEEAVEEQAEEAVEEQPAEEAQPVEEEQPVEEAVEEQPAEEAVEEQPAEEEQPVEEQTEEVVEETVEEQTEEVVEEHPAEEEQPVEEEQPAEEQAEEVVEETVEEQTEEVVEEQPTEEEQPAEEQPAEEEQRPVSNVKQVQLKEVNKKDDANKPRGPIAPVTPMAQEEQPVEEEVKEEKTLAPVSGPLHSTEKSKHDEIRPVEARKVKFEKRNYELKTYEGDLTSEEAFEKGVTKVQPSVNPVFANQGNEPAWKQKKRDEEIRKNGYGEVTQVEDLSTATKRAPVAAPVKGNSIREMAKASKVQEEAPVEENKEEQKLAKPAAPVAVNKTEEAPAQAPVEEAAPKQAPAFHPIAPIAKKDRPRPEIKPVDPLKKK